MESAELHYRIAGTWMQDPGCLSVLFSPLALLHYSQRDGKMDPSFGVSQSPYLEAPCLYENPYTPMKVAFCLTYAIYIYIYIAGEGPESPMKSPF